MSAAKEKPNGGDKPPTFVNLDVMFKDDAFVASVHKLALSRHGIKADTDMWFRTRIVFAVDMRALPSNDANYADCMSVVESAAAIALQQPGFCIRFIFFIPIDLYARIVFDGKYDSSKQSLLCFYPLGKTADPAEVASAIATTVSLAMQLVKESNTAVMKQLLAKKDLKARLQEDGVLNPGSADPEQLKTLLHFSKNGLFVNGNLNQWAMNFMMADLKTEKETAGSDDAMLTTTTTERFAALLTTKTNRVTATQIEKMQRLHTEVRAVANHPDRRAINAAEADMYLRILAAATTEEDALAACTGLCAVFA
jgi:hypothetical protein